MNSLRKIIRYFLGRHKPMNELKRYSKFQIGDGTYGSPKIHSWGAETLRIGSYCSIAGKVQIFLSGNHRTDWVTTFPFDRRYPNWQEIQVVQNSTISKGNVSIGNDVWIGYEALILSGVNIGDGAVVAARSVVTKDIPPYAIVAGNPAKIVKYRFSPEIIKQLLDISWWDWNPSQIKENINYLQSSDLQSFIQKNTESKTHNPL